MANKAAVLEQQVQMFTAQISENENREKSVIKQHEAVVQALMTSNYEIEQEKEIQVDRVL